MRLADVPMSTNVVDLCECLPKDNPDFFLAWTLGMLAGIAFVMLCKLFQKWREM